MEKADIEYNIDTCQIELVDGNDAQIEKKERDEMDIESEKIISKNCELTLHSSRSSANSLVCNSSVGGLKDESDFEPTTIVSTSTNDLLTLNHNNNNNRDITTASTNTESESGDNDENGHGSEKDIHLHDVASHVCEIKKEVTDTKSLILNGSSCDYEWDWDSNYDPEIVIKTEFDPDQSKTEMQDYRCATVLVDYSDSESESHLEESNSESEIQSPELCESSNDDDSEDYDNTDEDTDNCDIKAKRKKRRPKGDGNQRLRTTGEIFPEELPPLDYLSISAGENVLLEPLGTITGIVDVLVVIQSVDASPALFDDSVLFLENRQPLGLIFETMGTLDRPFYTVRFNSNDDIMNKDINIGDQVMYAPKASNLTKYVFISKLKKKKFVDASWESDNEPPPEELDYSDDDEEKRAMRKLEMTRKNLERKSGCKQDRKMEENSKKKKRSLKTKDAAGKDSSAAVSSNRSGLPQGALNRNPFSYSSITTAKPQLSSTTRTTSINNPSTTNFNSNNNNSSSSSAWSTNYRPPQSQIQFGGKPSWQANPWSMVPGSNINTSSSSSQFSPASPMFHSSLPPVYNTTIPSQFNFGFGSGINSFGGGGGVTGSTPTSVPQAAPLPPPGPLTYAPNPLGMPPAFTTNQPPPPLPLFTAQFNQSQPAPQTTAPPPPQMTMPPPPQTTVPPPPQNTIPPTINGLPPPPTSVPPPSQTPPPPFLQQTHHAIPPPNTYIVPFPPPNPFSFNFPPPSFMQNK